MRVVRSVVIAELLVRLVVFSVSTFGAFGPDALALLRTLSRLSGRTVPPSLLEEASWAAPVFASFARMSLSLSMRRSLAHRLREVGSPSRPPASSRGSLLRSPRIRTARLTRPRAIRLSPLERLAG